MKINSISQSQISFRGEEKPKVKDRGAKAFASFMVPGAGQFCEGRKEDGKKYLIPFVGISMVGSLLLRSPLLTRATDIKSYGKTPAVLCLVSLFGFIAASLGIKIASARNAYKGGKADTQKQNDTKEQNEKSRGGKLVASTFIPGLGQFIDGRVTDGIKFLGGFVGLNIISNLLNKPIKTGNISKMPLHVKLLSPLVSIGFIGLEAINMIDAYKGKKETKSEDTTNINKV